MMGEAERKKRREELNAWHAAVSEFNFGMRESGANSFKSSWMYEAIRASTEVERLADLLRDERLGLLPTLHRQCSISETEEVEDNHLTCCLGVKCRECPELAALDAAELSDDSRDKAKAWTCVTHIVGKGGDLAKEGYLLTVDDRMFWSNVYESLAADDVKGAGE